MIDFDTSIDLVEINFTIFRKLELKLKIKKIKITKIKII